MKSGSRTYIQHIECIYQGRLVNQGITMCNAGHDPSKCDMCPYKQSEEHEVTESWASTEDIDGISYATTDDNDAQLELYYDQASGKLINFEP